MKETSPLSGRVLSLFVVWTMVFAALTVAAVQTSMPARAATNCSQSNVIIGGDWTVTGNELCEGTLYTMTGNLIVTGTLELRDGGIQFAQTPSSTHSVTVTGTLILTHSVITVTGDTVSPYLKFHVNVNAPGRLDMVSNSSLMFPGWLNATGPGASIVMHDSRITGLGAGQQAKWSNDTNDQYAPMMSFSSSSVQLYDSFVYNLFEGAVDARRDINVSGTTSFLAINTYIGIDLDQATFASHNALSLRDTAQAFLLWPLIEPTNNTPITWSAPVVTMNASAAYIYRRVDVTVVDKNGAPVPLATLRMTYTGTTNDAQYPDRGPGAIVPSDSVLTYLHTNVTYWATTDERGQVSIPLISDKIDVTGTHFWGNYNVTASKGGPPAIEQIGLAHWPVVNDAVNKVPMLLQLTGIQMPLPDLTPAGVTLDPAHPLENRTTVNITISIQNIGPGAARNVEVGAYFNSESPTGLIHKETLPYIAGMSIVTLNQFAWKPPQGSGGNNLIIVWVDQPMTIRELRDDNNRISYPLYVTPLGPDLATVVGAMTGFVENPVDLIASVSNLGDKTATHVSVSFYLGSLSNLLGTNDTVNDMAVGNTTQVTFTWVPLDPGNYTIYAWAKSSVEEQLPYNVTNNIDQNILTVRLSPNPMAYSDEIGAADPYPTSGSAVSLYAVVRNAGQADITQRFSARFSIDGVEISNDFVNPAGDTVHAGDQVLLTSSGMWTAVGCGFQTLQVDVDSDKNVPEGKMFEADNNVTRTMQVFGDKPTLTYSTDQTLQYLPVAQSIIIRSHITVVDGSIIVTQPQEPCGRVFIKILDGGSLILINSTITARDSDNWPLVIYVGGTGNSKFEASKNSKILLNTNNGDGILEVGQNGVISLTDTMVNGDISAHGLAATFNRVTFMGKKLHTYTQSPTRIWDPVFRGADYLALRSDDQVKGTMDVDLRNATLDATLTGQLVFGGHQWAHITNVTTTKMTRWWEGAITEDAKVTRYWWLTVEAVDGTGAPLKPEANAAITITRLNTQTLNFEQIPQPLIHGDDIFGTANDTLFGAQVPNGVLLFKAPSEDRYADIRKQWTNATYKVTGGATINGTPYAPDADVIVFANHSMTVRLRFSALTPDLEVVSISFDGMGDRAEQPVNEPLNISAIIRNTGKISLGLVRVNFYFTDVIAFNQNPGYMDYSNATYANFFVGSDWITISANATAMSQVTWNRPSGYFNTAVPISVVVDPPVSSDPKDGGLIKETNEENNILETTVTIFTWPDLHLEVAQIQIGRPVSGIPISIQVTVLNQGTSAAIGAIVELRVDGNPAVVMSNPFDVFQGGSASTVVIWNPTIIGDHSLAFTANVTGALGNRDYHPSDNTARMTITVFGPADLILRQSEFRVSPAHYDVKQGLTLPLDVKVYNDGFTDATMFTVGVFLVTGAQWPPVTLLTSMSNISVSAGANKSLAIVVPWFATLAGSTWHNFTIWADSTNVVFESSKNNNAVNATIMILPPDGQVYILGPSDGAEFKPGAQIAVTGQVLSLANDPITNMPLTAELSDSNGRVVDSSSSSSSADLGTFTLVIDTADLADGDYSIHVASNITSILSATISIKLKTPQVPTILGLPPWLFLLIIIIIIVVVVAIVLYTRRVGLGKMVECGECGAFIPEDSTKCPKCGVEFEKDMAKCSNCQAWIPLDVKECPECHVQFATGEVEMADYEQKMRVQYDEVKAKFRQVAEQELGKAMTDQEFEEWWKKQPTFVTFEDWLREEEEMRKMGSKACPTCGTLNSITATVCHKCGTLMKKEEGKKATKPPPRGREEAPKKEAEAPPSEAPTAAEPRPTEPIPKKVVVKKPIAPTVIQKKVVVKKPFEEKKEGESTEGTSSEEEI